MAEPDTHLADRRVVPGELQPLCIGMFLGHHHEYSESFEWGEADYAFFIPEGTGDRLDRGSSVEIMPNWLDVRVGETIEIVNDDDRGHLVGPFYVGARETLRQRFPAEGRFEGVCTVHPSGQIVVNVTA